MPTSNYPSGFANGLLVRGMPILQTQPGRVFWVGNSATPLPGTVSGADGNPGTYQRPLATLAVALAKCSANAGDIIMVKPGHAETLAVAAALTLDVAGVAIVGLGSGTNRPTLTWSAVASTVAVAASNVAIQNFLFIGSMATTFTAVAFNNANAVVANDFAIENCEFRDLDATHGFVACFKGGTTANQNDGLRFVGNKVFRQLTSPPAANTAVITQAAINRLTFGNNLIVNKAANNNIALGFALGANAVQNLECYGNRTYSLNTGTTAGELFSGGSTTSSGLVYDNYSWHLAATGLLAPVSTKLGFVQNFCSITGAADKSALLNPVAV